MKLKGSVAKRLAAVDRQALLTLASRQASEIGQALPHLPGPILADMTCTEEHLSFQTVKMQQLAPVSWLQSHAHASQ